MYLILMKVIFISHGIIYQYGWINLKIIQKKFIYLQNKGYKTLYIRIIMKTFNNISAIFPQDQDQPQKLWTSCLLSES